MSEMFGLWQKWTQAVALAGKVLAAALSLEVVGGSVDVPSSRITLPGRRYRVDAKVTREA